MVNRPLKLNIQSPHLNDFERKFTFENLPFESTYFSKREFFINTNKRQINIDDRLFHAMERFRNIFKKD